MSYRLSVPDVDPFYFWISVAALFLISAFLSLYMIVFVWNFGAALRKYFYARISNNGIVQEYSHENMYLHYADVKNNNFKVLGEPIIKKDHWWSIAKRIATNISLIGKSIITINGVPTLMVWNVAPKLPEKYIQCLKILQEKGIESVDEIISAINDVDSGVTESDFILSDFTIKEFLLLHKAVRSKYEISVTIEDVLNFEDKYFNEHPRGALIEREVTVEKRRLLDKKYQKWAFYIIGSEVLIGFMLLAYKMVNGGTPA